MDGVIDLKPFWNYAPKTDPQISKDEAVEEYRRLFQAAVRRQMISDVPIGLLLSGGVDSAAIGMLMQRESKAPIKTFSIGFPGEGDHNELDDARATARLIGSEHFEMTISRQEYLDFFLDSFHFTEEPIAEPTIPALYHVSRLAAKHLKVVLAGQGADEPLAGYHRYLGEKIIADGGSLLRALPLRTLASLLPRNERLKRAAYATRFQREENRFLAIYTIFTPDQKAKLMNGHTARRTNNVDRELVGHLHHQTSHLTDSLSRLLFIDTRMSLSDNLLLFGDKMTMANSLEMRVPFLDVEFIKFVESLPGSLKIKGTTRKYIHKKAVEAWLPGEIIHRKKRGFATPIDKWLQNDLVGFARKVLLSSQSATRQYFEPEYVSRMIDDHAMRRENFQRHLFALLSFELWHKSFFENSAIDKELVLHEH
jgi:asparagine synthase (glutamine-hydrolysing)